MTDNLSPRPPEPLARGCAVLLMLCLAVVAIAGTIALVRWLL